MPAKTSILLLIIASSNGLSLMSAANASPSQSSSTASTSNVASSSTGGAGTPIDKAQRAYLAGRFSDAMAQLEPWIKVHPKDAVGHYLQANCLLKAGRNAEASYEYARAEQLAPASKIADYCRAAQSQLIVRKDDNSGAKKNIDLDEEADDPEDSSAAPDRASKTASTEKVIQPSATSRSKLPPGTLELIRKQAEMARRRALVDGATEADNERLKATNEARSLQEKAERLAGRSRIGNEPITLSPEEKDRLRSQSAASSELLKQIGEFKAAQAEEGSRYKAEEIQRQSEHLQQQLLDDRIGGSKLNPVGTNLYIRNYAKPPVAAMRAQMKSLSIDSTITSRRTNLKLTGHSPNGSVVDHSSTSHGIGRAETLVKGKVLEK